MFSYKNVIAHTAFEFNLAINIIIIISYKYTIL